MSEPRVLLLFDPEARPQNWNERMSPGEYAVLYKQEKQLQGQLQCAADGCMDQWMAQIKSVMSSCWGAPAVKRSAAWTMQVISCWAVVEQAGWVSRV